MCQGGKNNPTSTGCCLFLKRHRLLSASRKLASSISFFPLKLKKRNKTLLFSFGYEWKTHHCFATTTPYHTAGLPITERNGRRINLPPRQHDQGTSVSSLSSQIGRPPGPCQSGIRRLRATGTKLPRRAEAASLQAAAVQHRCRTAQAQVPAPIAAIF